MTERDEERLVRAVRGRVLTEVRDRLAESVPLADEQVPEVLVRTRVGLPAEAWSDIRSAVREIRATFGDGDGRIRVEFDVAADAVEPCDVTCAMPKPRAAEPEPAAQAAPGAPADEAWLLVLGADGLEFHFLLEPGPDRVPLLRPGAGYDGTGLLLPQSLSDVPHGHLVDLSFAGGRVRAHRVPDRADYTVEVDGVELDAAGIGLAESGELRFAARNGSAARTLTYELAGWNDAVPSAGTGADVLDGGQYQTESADPGSPGALWIQPPAPGTKATTRRFPLPTGRSDVPVHDVHVQVLYTTAQHPVTKEPSHIKIYRCATPQHAGYLRRHLATQAGLVRQANAVAGRPGERSWAVAPIHLVAATPPPEVLTARADPAAVRGGAENRLSAWFGVPDQPQPDCFVIVASPLLQPVGWAGHDKLGTAPSGAPLSALSALAAGVDQLHDLGVAHCDVKPQNVCHHLDAAGQSRYVLVDGDAVTRIGGPAAALRFTPGYASAEVIRAAGRFRAPGHDVIDVREHDRFGFVLVVLTALIGIDKVDALLRGPVGKRPVDSVSTVLDTLNAWPAEWSTFKQALVAPLRPNALLDPDWSAKAWLDRLVALRSPAPGPAPTSAGGARVANGSYGNEVTAIRTALRDDRAPAWAEWREELVTRIRAQQQVVARRVYRSWLWSGRAVFAVCLIVLISVVAGEL
ncbi:hypothetical protein ABZ816_34115 [Actinosynnema sp. NPDC047251]|uniref:Protein kinase domain-containing protein n=1 Tax=Saccharothrix espanaensis (strain ATCC 51144 / DSM 44229 / JCM 9112 / NBRC 15066 / NRRL 15764) TaxID=1179773 RepID=K0K3U8_SACES|nr:hypothetical protein [Saccharothrix espanaensis]CCH32262.1 hypothetical protein BN6_49940 [Saccharothrix espanaensis DSM 44229]